MTLDVYFLPTQTAQLPHGVFSTRIYAWNYFAIVKPIKLLHLTQNKSGTVSTIPLDVYFFQRRRHGCHMAFSLLESMHGIISPASSLSSCCISHKTKAVQFPPYRLMFIFFRRRRHDYHMVFLSTRICILPASNLSGKLLHPTQNKSSRASTIPLDVYFFQRRRHDCRRAFSLLESVH